MRDDGVGGERGSLEQVQEGTGMKGLLSVVDSDFGVFGGNGGEECGAEFEFYTAGDLVIELDFCVEGIEGCPALGQGDAAVGVFTLEFA